MANLPATTAQSTELTANDRLEDTIAELISQGKRPDEIARQVHANDHNKRRSLRRRIWYLVRYDSNFANRLAARARGEMLLSLVPATTALGARAARGRPDAIKLLYEASGFHNPRIKHDHSGEIKIKLEMPRPQFDNVVDGEVVDDVSP